MSSLLTSWPSQFWAYPCPLACVQPPLPSKKSERSSFPIFLRGGAAVHRLVPLPREFLSSSHNEVCPVSGHLLPFWKQRHVALYSDEAALVLDTFTTYFGYLGRFRFIYNSPSSWSSRKDKSITKLQSATKFWRHCKQIGYLQRTKESTPLPPTLHSSSSSSSSSLSSGRASLGIHESITPSITALQQSREVV